MISITCGSCNKQLKVKDELAGKKVKCPGCQKPVAVPQLAASLSPRPTLGLESSNLGEERTLPPRPQTDKESLFDTGEATALGAGGKGQETQAYPTEAPSPQTWDFLAPAEKPDEIGRLGTYRVLKVLGAGGMGVVFRAEDPHLERLVALKAMLPSMASSPSAKERFFREAKAAAALKHPHIVTIFQVGEDRGAPFLAMEFLEGEALDDRLKRETRLPVPEILRIGREIAEGLEAAHEKGLIHRDIKPANLWLEGKKGHVKILDFGLARAMGDTAHLTQSGAIIGTPAYMAPEQAGGKQVDSRCDLFSLGCVLYCMCTGERPFKGNDTISILSALALENPPPPVSLNLELPTELSDLVMQLLAKKPEDRPKSAKMVAETLHGIEGQTAAPARKTQKVKKGETKQMEATRTYAGQSVKRRLPLPWLVGVGVVALSVVAAMILFWPQPQGTIRIESDDPKFEIVFLKDGPIIKGAGNKLIPIRSGEYSLLVKRGNSSFETNRFFIGTDKTVTFRIEALPGKTQVSMDGRVIGVDEPSLPKPFTNSLGMKFVWIPPGSFIMGSPKEEKERGENETQHKVTLTKGFYMGVYTVTQEQWQEVMGNNPSHSKDQKNLPVDSVSWNDCQVFIKKLREKDKKRYRLPTEAEWEYACRAGTTTPFFFGETISTDQANYNGDPYGNGKKGVFRGKTIPVGSFPANAWGLHDMSGNVWQWCEDWFGNYPQEDVVDPTGPSIGQVRVLRVVRGGSWLNNPKKCRSAFRDGDVPGDRGNSYYGLRACFCLEEDGILAPKKDPPKKAEVAVSPNPFTNSLGMEFVLVPKGKSWLGGGGGKMGDKEVEIVQDFYLGKYEVTQEEWEKVTGNNPSHFKAVPGVAKDDQKRFPVENVSWEDCQAFVERLNKQVKEAGWVYRLPMEAEWEYACRDGPCDKRDSAFDFYFEKPTNQLLPEQANFEHGKGLERTCKVGSYKPNRLGLYDMHGNIWEWCEDLYDTNAKGVSRRVRRGGGWNIDSGNCRAGHRYGNAPSDRLNLGLRLARVPISKEPVAPTVPAVVDLLKLVDPKRDAVKGAWMLGPDGLVSDGNVPFCRLKLPYHPPAEYDFRIDFTAKGGNDILQILVAGERGVTWVMGGWGGKWDGFDSVAGRPFNRDGVNIIGAASSIKKNQRHTSVVQVRNGFITARIDGKLVTKYQTDFSDLSVPEPWMVGPGVLGIGTTFDATVFHKIEVVEVSGMRPVTSPTFTNSLGMEFVLVPKGKSWLGGGGGNPGDKEVELVHDFYLGKYEVTQEEWEKVTGNNPSKFKAVPGVAIEDQKRFPVEMVSWDDTQAFIKQLNKKAKEAGWVYRLPKEVEWEYACRGGPGDKRDSAFDFYFEKPTNQLQPKQASFWHGKGGKGLKRTCKVGSYQPNRLGLFDMHGNVWEWSEDLDDPKDAKGASRRVFRGGGWNSDSGNCRAADRNASPPFDRGHDLGLRLARVPVGKEAK